MGHLETHDASWRESVPMLKTAFKWVIDPSDMCGMDHFKDEVSIMDHAAKMTQSTDERDRLDRESLDRKGLDREGQGGGLRLVGDMEIKMCPECLGDGRVACPQTVAVRTMGLNGVPTLQPSTGHPIPCPTCQGKRVVVG